MLKLRAGFVVTTFAGDTGVAPTVDIDAMRKGLRTMLDESTALGVPLPVAAQKLGAQRVRRGE